jgi:hypothetical protein
MILPPGWNRVKLFLDAPGEAAGNRFVERRSHQGKQTAADIGLLGFAQAVRSVSGVITCHAIGAYQSVKSVCLPTVPRRLSQAQEFSIPSFRRLRLPAYAPFSIL